MSNETIIPSGQAAEQHRGEVEIIEPGTGNIQTRLGELCIVTAHGNVAVPDATNDIGATVTHYPGQATITRAGDIPYASIDCPIQNPQGWEFRQLREITITFKSVDDASIEELAVYFDCCREVYFRGLGRKSTFTLFLRPPGVTTYKVTMGINIQLGIRLPQQDSRIELESENLGFSSVTPRIPRA